MAGIVAWSNLLWAVAMVETHNLPNRINQAEQAYGVLQIRQPALDDLNRKWKTNYKLTAFLGEAGVTLSVRAFIEYGAMYGAKTPEDYVRIWNGGPRGARKRATLAYWRRVNSVAKFGEAKI
jgi:hypothetical protein